MLNPVHLFVVRWMEGGRPSSTEFRTKIGAEFEFERLQARGAKGLVLVEVVETVITEIVIASHKGNLTEAEIRKGGTNLKPLTPRPSVPPPPQRPAEIEEADAVSPEMQEAIRSLDRQPAVGDIVHYVRSDGVHMPAIVTAVASFLTHGLPPQCCLVVFGTMTARPWPIAELSAVCHDDQGRHMSWHWPEETG